MNKFNIGDVVTEKRNNYPMTIIDVVERYKVPNEVVYVCQWNVDGKSDIGNFLEEEIKLFN